MPAAAMPMAVTARRGVSSLRAFREFPFVPVFVGANVTVWAGWQLANMRPGARERREAVTFMRRHFMMSLESVANGRLWTMVTANFSHYDFWHLALNSYMLWMFGGQAARVLGGAGFVRLYLFGAAGCVVAALGSDLLRFQAFQQQGRRRPGRYTPTAHLGASGAVNALVIFACALAPMQSWLIWGIIPMPACVVGALFVGYDLYAAGSRDGVSHYGHLGGAAAGALYFLVFKRRMARRF